MPPRHGKSALVSHWLPVWFLDLFPQYRVILASYESDYAATWGRKVRNTIQEHPGELRVEISGDSSAANRWDTTEGGGMNAVGTQSAVTGKGAQCLYGKTLITTEKGKISIEDLVRMPLRPRVLAFNHRSNLFEWRKILAVRVTYGNRLLEIETASGHKVRATYRHRFYTCERGYQEANSLRPGDRLISSEVQVQQDLRSLWESEGRQRLTLPSLLPETSIGQSSSSLYSLREGARKIPVRLPQSTESGARRLLLLQGMLSKASCRKACEILRLLRPANAWETSEQILLRDLPHSFQTIQEACENLPDLRGRVYSSLFPCPVLLSGMCERCPFRENGWTWKLPLSGWDELRNVVHSNETFDPGARRPQVCRLWIAGGLHSDNLERTGCSEVESCYSSLKRGCAGQYTRKSCNSLSTLPYDSSQIKIDPVSVVRELRCGEIPVYDIQVEGCNNFFAEEVLTHNCLIIDDPHKDREQAESPTMREKVWDWWTGTAESVWSLCHGRPSGSSSSWPPAGM